MFLSVGQVARELGMSTETLKKWENAGLIPQAQRRHLNKWRYWSIEDFERIKQVVEAQRR